MAHNLAAIAFLAPDYDEGIAWFRDRLGFSLLEDRPLGGGKRWVVVGDPQRLGARFVVAKAEGERQLAAIGAQAGGRVAYFLETDDFARDFSRFSENGVEFVESAAARSLWGRRGVQGPVGRQMGSHPARPHGRARAVAAAGRAVGLGDRGGRRHRADAGPRDRAFRDRHRARLSAQSRRGMAAKARLQPAGGGADDSVRLRRRDRPRRRRACAGVAAPDRAILDQAAGIHRHAADARHDQRRAIPRRAWRAVAAATWA